MTEIKRCRTAHSLREILPMQLKQGYKWGVDISENRLKKFTYQSHDP